MDDDFDAAWMEPNRAGNTTIEAELASLIDIYGLALLDDSAQISSLLLQACPNAGSQVAAIVGALNAGALTRLCGAKADAALPDVLQEAARDLESHALFDPMRATWAIRTWAHALALPTSGLPADARPPIEESLPHHVVPFPILDEPLESGDDFGGNTGDILPAGRPAALSVIAGSPSAMPRVGERVLRDEDPIDLVARGTPSFQASQPWDRPHQPATRRFALPVVIVMLLVVLGLVAWVGLDAGRWLDDAPRSRQPESAAKDALRPIAAVGASPAGPTPEATDGPPVASAIAPSPTTPLAPADPPAHEPSSMSGVTKAGASGTLPTPVAPPDTRSSNAEKTSDAATRTTAPPAAHAKPAIARIDVPRLVDGAPFDVVLQLTGNASDVAFVERKYVTSVGDWPRLGAVSPGAGLRTAGRSALRVPFHAIDAPAHATVEFTVVGRDGSRSLPKVATFAVAETLLPPGIRAAAGQR
ncbi:MAG: hypothetical protein ABI277_02440 [Burkholderiaceae bacterium]